MKRKTLIISAAVVFAVGVIALASHDGEFEVECHPWRKHYLGTFEQREGPGTTSTVEFGDGEVVEGTGRSPDSPYRAGGSGTWRVGEDNLVEWTIDGVNRLETGDSVRWRPTYVADSFECDDSGRVVRITGNGTDTAPFPSRFDFVRVDLTVRTRGATVVSPVRGNLCGHGRARTVRPARGRSAATFPAAGSTGLGGLPAGGEDASCFDRGTCRAGASLGRRVATSPVGRRGRPFVGDPVGPARVRQDHRCPPGRGRD